MKYILAVTAAAAGILILTDPTAISAAVKASVSCCLEIIIPSLYAFTMLSVYLQESGLYRLVLKPLTVPLSKLMAIPQELCAVFILSNIGGYPVGAKLLSRLVGSGRLSSQHASRMMCCCFGSGPSFIIGVVGTRVFDSAAAGGLLFAASFITSLVIGIFVCRCGERIHLAEERSAIDLTGACFISSATAAAKVMYTVCVMIVCFSVVTALLDTAGITSAIQWLFHAAGAGENAEAILPAALEISAIREVIPAPAAAPLCGALLAFGGVCVNMQAAAILPQEVSIKPFLLSRLPAAAISAVLSLSVCALPPKAAEAYSAAYTSAEPFSVNIGLSVSVLVMAALLLWSAERIRKEE